MENSNKRHPTDVAQVLNQYGQQFLSKHKLSLVQLRAFNDICKCRTAALGGHVNVCDHCNHRQVSYNSCRNRNCNKCQYIKQLKWVDALQSNLPVCRYFHAVFTIPDLLHKLFYLNQRVCYSLLFKAASQALLKVGKNPRFLGAQTGAVAVLHTWGQALTYHPHIHMLIPAGGLSDDGTEWVKAHKKFFLPVKVLSKVFRGVLWSLLEKEWLEGNIKLPDKPRISVLKKQLYVKNWNVYIKKSMAGPQAVVQYLGKYTHRVAICNSRIVDIESGRVTFRWKNYRNKTAPCKRLTLQADEFIGRFLRHVLPAGFYKIRYYGILAVACKHKKDQCACLINKPVHLPILMGMSAKEVVRVVTGMDPDSCPACKKGKMTPLIILDPG